MPVRLEHNFLPVLRLILKMNQLLKGKCKFSQIMTTQKPAKKICRALSLKTKLFQVICNVEEIALNDRITYRCNI